VPFTSEAKEAVAHYDELRREMKLAVQECGRKLGAHLRAREREASEHKRLGIFQRYIPEVSAALGNILGSPKEKIEKAFNSALPNFVRVADDTGTNGSGTNGTPDVPPAPPSMPPPPRDSEVPPAPAATAKGKKKRAEQLTLL
jgi:hypothetical protein